MTRLIRIGAIFAAQWVLAQGDIEQFIRDLREQTRQNPQRLDLQLALGNAAVQAQQYDLAVDAFQKVLTSLGADAPEAGDVLLRLGETFRRKGDAEAAVGALAHARELMPDNPIVLGTLALVLDGAGKYPEAQEAYRATLKL